MNTVKSAVLGLIAVIGLSGCIHPFNKEPTLTYHADKRFTPPERQCIKESTDKWSTQTSGLADISVEYDYDPTSVGSVLEYKGKDRLVRWTSNTPEVKEFEGRMREAEDVEEWTLLGLASGKLTDPVRVPFEVRLVADRFVDKEGQFSNHMCQLTTIHEFGHNFGIPHLPRRTNIMYQSVIMDRTACLKHEDLFAFSLLNKLPMSLMKPCPDDVVFELPSSSASPEDEDATNGAVWISVGPSKWQFGTN